MLPYKKRLVVKRRLFAKQEVNKEHISKDNSDNIEDNLIQINKTLPKLPSVKMVNCKNSINSNKQPKKRDRTGSRIVNPSKKTHNDAAITTCNEESHKDTVNIANTSKNSVKLYSIKVTTPIRKAKTIRKYATKEDKADNRVNGGKAPTANIREGSGIRKIATTNNGFREESQVKRDTDREPSTGAQGKNNDASTKQITHKDMKATPKMIDVKQIFRKKRQDEFNGNLSRVPRPNVFHTYLSHHEIIQYLTYLESRYGDFVKVHTLGLSDEKRPIRAIEIDWNSYGTRNVQVENKSLSYRNRSTRKRTAIPTRSKSCDQKKRDTVFIEAGTHAREWSSVSAALHCISQLVEKFVRHQDILEKLRFFIVPLVNPDGYEHSQSTNLRLRKNHGPALDLKVTGTDCNRNCDCQLHSTAVNPNQKKFPSEKRLAKTVTKAIAKMLKELAPRLMIFISLHSNAQSIMYPWAYTKNQPSNADMMFEIANAGRDAIRACNGQEYTIGSVAEVNSGWLQGSEADYVHGVIKVPLVFIIELPAKRMGFQSPPNAFNPVCRESWIGIREMCRVAHAKYTLTGNARDKTENQV